MGLHVYYYFACVAHLRVFWETLRPIWYVNVNFVPSKRDKNFYKLREEFKITRLINFGVCGLILCFPKRLGNGRGKEGIVAVPSTLFTNRVITSDNSSVNEKAHGARKSEVVSWKSDPEQVMKFWNSWNFLGCTVMDKRQSTDRHCYPDFTRIILSNISSRSNVPWKGPAIL